MKDKLTHASRFKHIYKKFVNYWLKQFFNEWTYDDNAR